MYLDRESQREFIEIDFGDGMATSSLEPTNEPVVVLEPQISQAQQFIAIDFGSGDDINEEKTVVGPEPLPSKLITIDFDAIEKTKVEPTGKVPQIETEKKGLIEIDFGTGVEEENVASNTPINESDTNNFMEIDFGEGDVVQTRIQTQIQFSPKAAPVSRGLELNGPRPANTVLFFVPGTKKGLLIYNQSPTGAEAKFAGYLPEGTFHASGMEPVDFDSNKHSEEFDYIKTPNGSYIQRVIMVDEKTIMKIALQGIYQKSPEAEHRRHYFIVNIHDEERNLRRELIQATYEEDDLPEKQRAIFDVIREVGKTDQGKNVIGDIITGSNSKKAS